MSSRNVLHAIGLIVVTPMLSAAIAAILLS